ncbi:hypothetical protein ABES33_27105 [Bacillus pseudomycoides]|uniref:hypothetical protein n=1 Tax=Bacillus pseudomycoides TaxID=64104 RepID=UPI003D2306D0
MIIINMLLGIIGAILLLVFVVHPGVPDKRVPLKNKLAVNLSIDCYSRSNFLVYIAATSL